MKRSWLSLNVQNLETYFYAPMMVRDIKVFIHVNIAHFMVVKVSEDLKAFKIVNDISHFTERNEYRYVRHAAIHGSQIVFVSELGKDLNKIVYFKYDQGEVTLLKEYYG